jgi:hypothetical protein
MVKFGVASPFFDGRAVCRNLSHKAVGNFEGGFGGLSFRYP